MVAIKDITDNKVFSVAPGKGQKPLSIFNDIYFEEMCNPTKYSSGPSELLTERQTKLTVHNYLNSDC